MTRASPRLLLCTDLDRTLLPNGKQSESNSARQRFRSLVAHPQVVLVYVTGRHQGLVEQAIHNYQIPQPDYVIADVGSSIYKILDANWYHWQVWEDKISKDWQGKTHDEIHAIFNKLLLPERKKLRLQEFSKQNSHKISYYVPLYVDHTALIDRMNTLLQQQHIHANLIWSIDEQMSIGLLDVLPASAGKRQGIEFLMQHLEFSTRETVFAGDSGNDISVMASPLQAVLVANASDEVRELARQEAKINGQLKNLYFARGNYLGMNGNYSAGILEGVAHYLPEIESWFTQPS